MIQSCDSSLRFVMEPDSVYVKNLAALWAADPALARAIESLHPQDSQNS
jgi:hypothetical protein